MKQGTTFGLRSFDIRGASHDVTVRDKRQHQQEKKKENHSKPGGEGLKKFK